MYIVWSSQRKRTTTLMCNAIHHTRTPLFFLQYQIMHYVSKGEAICDLALPVDTLSGIRSCLFEECRENGLTHPNNVIKLKGLAINSLGHLAPSRLFTEPEGCPTNHDQEQEERLSCPKLMEEQMQN